MTKAHFNIPERLQRALQEPSFSSSYRRRRRVSRINRLTNGLRRALDDTLDLNELGRAFAFYRELRLFTALCLRYATPSQLQALHASSLLSDALETSIEAASALCAVDEEFLRQCCRHGSPKSLLTQALVDPKLSTRTPSSDVALESALRHLQRFRDLGFQPESSHYMKTIRLSWILTDFSGSARLYLNFRALPCLVREGLSLSSIERLTGPQLRTHHLYTLLLWLQPSELPTELLDRVLTDTKLQHFIRNLHELQIPVTADQLKSFDRTSTSTPHLL